MGDERCRDCCERDCIRDCKEKCYQECCCDNGGGLSIIWILVILYLLFRSNGNGRGGYSSQDCFKKYA